MLATVGNIMKCVICKHGETPPGTSSLTLERGGTPLVIREVPSNIAILAAKPITVRR